ncbi:hypothetical protein GCM10022289_07630 [Pedobacter jeongneungensis]|uniref:Uncharacterized protein n=1 Tax=Pedobacter jeongneungensis TaxID=947309 RepID=A0ABP8B5U3_9SPHI|nr:MULTISPECIES: hypothetical protein [Pedobacter]QIL40582.1 hypothetical protein G7074_15700 [Pedobacter sp. HDW13]RQO66862.1 hypothetical protein DBR40_21660 [Pedobacter sp. KBW01]
MAKQQFKLRNQDVKTYFDDLCRKYPEWRLDALEEKTAQRFYISPRTVRAILKGEGNYAL